MLVVVQQELYFHQILDSFAQLLSCVFFAVSNDLVACRFPSFLRSKLEAIVPLTSKMDARTTKRGCIPFIQGSGREKNGIKGARERTYSQTTGPGEGILC